MLRQLATHPGAGVTPFAFYRRMRDTNHLGRLLDGQPAEESQLHDAGLVGINLGQTRQSVMKRNNLGGLLLSHVDAIQRNLELVSSALCVVSRPCVIDQNLPHQASRDAEEMSAALPWHALIDQPQIGLVDQRRRLKGMVLPACDAGPAFEAPRRRQG